MAKIFKRCACPEGTRESCPHQWVVRYRTIGGRSSRQHEQSFGTDLCEAEGFALKVEHDKRARTFVDPTAGQVLFRAAAETWLDQHLGAGSSIATYRSVPRAHIDPAMGGKPIGVIRREDNIKAPIASRCSSSRSPLGGGTGYERGTLCVRGDVLLWVALQASLMAECFADGAGDTDCGIGVSELVGASHVSEHAADGDFRLCRAGCSSCWR